MNVAELFIRRPVATTLVMAAILVFGLFAYTHLLEGRQQAVEPAGVGAGRGGADGAGQGQGHGVAHFGAAR